MRAASWELLYQLTVLAVLAKVRHQVSGHFTRVRSTACARALVRARPRALRQKGQLPLSSTSGRTSQSTWPVSMRARPPLVSPWRSAASSFRVAVPRAVVFLTGGNVTAKLAACAAASPHHQPRLVPTTTNQPCGRAQLQPGSLVGAGAQRRFRRKHAARRNPGIIPVAVKSISARPPASACPAGARAGVDAGAAGPSPHPVLPGCWPVVCRDSCYRRRMR